MMIPAMTIIVSHSGMYSVMRAACAARRAEGRAAQQGRELGSGCAQRESTRRPGPAWRQSETEEVTCGLAHLVEHNQGLQKLMSVSGGVQQQAGVVLERVVAQEVRGRELRKNEGEEAEG